ncbi:MAG: oligosaccharide flippase family protein, partial [Candidatus Promineifilaceae bacterium]|nr:oligosaccharide flippase family protein [Candidatus Promineifilaceae bacterium]
MLRPLLVRVAALLDPTTRGWFTVLAGDLGRLLLGFGASILITRTLGPSRFGIYAVLGAIVALVGVFADAGLSQAANRYLAAIWQRSPERARKRGGAFFWLRLSLALLVVAAALLLTRPLIVLFDLPPAPDAPTALLLTLALAGVVAGALSGATATLLQITGRFQAVATTLVVNTGLTLLLAAVLAAISALNLVSALLLLGIVPSLVAALLGWRLLPGRWRLHLPSVRYLRRVAGTFLHFGRWLWLANLLTMLTLQLDLLLLNHFSVEVAVVYPVVCMHVTQDKCAGWSRCVGPTLGDSTAPHRTTGSEMIHSEMTVYPIISTVIGRCANRAERGVGYRRRVTAWEATTATTWPTVMSPTCEAQNAGTDSHPRGSVGATP